MTHATRKRSAPRIAPRIAPTIAALACAAIVLSGCGAGAEPGRATAMRGLSHRQELQLLELIASARTQATAGHEQQARSDLTRFSADVSSLRADGTLNAARASQLSARAAAARGALPAQTITEATTTAANAGTTNPAAPPASGGGSWSDRGPHPHGPAANPPGGQPATGHPPGGHPPGGDPQAAGAQVGTTAQPGSSPLSGPSGPGHGPGWWRHHPWQQPGFSGASDN